MTKSKLFISYRRSDAIDTVRALYFQLRLRFGLSQVFMDVSTIVPGDVWPQRLQQALAEASVVLVVIGPTWLTSADQYGRRRLDRADDWVRLEIESALTHGKKVIPILVGGLPGLPPAEALPPSLTRLRDMQQYSLTDGSWETDVQSLSGVLTNHHGFELIDVDVVRPLADPAKSKLRPLSEEQLFAELQGLPGWEPVESSILRDYPKSRHELRRGFRFTKFIYAIEFLQALAQPLQALKHHPRIENQWRTVFVHFTTWDAGNRITAADVEAARVVNDVHAAFSSAVKERENANKR